MKRRYIVLLCLLGFLVISFGILIFIDRNIKIKSIKLLNYDSNNKEITIEIEKEKNIIPINYKCVLKTSEESIVVKANNNICTVTLKVPNDYKVIVKNNYNKSDEYKLIDYIDNRLDFTFIDDTIYLALGESKKIEYIGSNIFNIDDYHFYVDDETIASIDEDNNIIGISSGSTLLYEQISNKTVNVIVTDLITKETIPSERKTLVPCNIYSDEENELMDAILKDDVEKAGYKTRAGAVAAARFLTLKFKYRIPYFYENGRLSDTGINKADGEGRYYHTGLYLSESKKDDISVSFSGLSIWGCPLRNWEDDPYFGYKEGYYMPNGLDCSGFVSWALVNGGFDPGDIGAGETPDAYQMTDLGEFVKLDEELLDSNVIKAGDFFNYWGHISIIVGIKDGIYYVAESLPNFDGVDLRIYNKEEALDMFRYVVLMDSYYKEDGNYTEYWD